MPFLMRWMTPKMDSFVGPDYELGLVLLRGRLDDDADKPVITFGDVIHRAPVSCLTMATSGDLPTIRQTMREEFPNIVTAAGENAAGRALTIYHKMGGDGEWFAVDMAVPLHFRGGAGDDDDKGFADNMATPSHFGGGNNYIGKTLAGGNYLPVTLRGDYQYLKHAWRTAFIHARQMRKLRIDKKRPAFEIYQNNPQTIAAADLITTIHIPVAVPSA